MKYHILHHEVVASPKTAILLFAESVQVQAQKKVLHHSRQANYQLLHQLTRRSLKMARNTRLPVYHFKEDDQIGVSFSQKISHALQQLFDRGYDKVIAIGSDSPDLNTKDIRKAATALRTGRMVVGPDLRGGVYLLGLDSSQFDKNRFEQLHWQTKTLRQSLVDYARSSGESIDWLSPKADFNDQKELQTYWTISNAIRAIISLLKALQPYLLDVVYILHFIPTHCSVRRRGPPVPAT